MSGGGRDEMLSHFKQKIEQAVAVADHTSHLKLVTLDQSTNFPPRKFSMPGGSSGGLAAEGVAAKLEGLVKKMEVTLKEMEQLKLHCGKQSDDLSQLIVELRRENQELGEKYDQLALDMKEAREIIVQLQDTKVAFDAKERQAQKLARQL